MAGYYQVNISHLKKCKSVNIVWCYYKHVFSYVQLRYTENAIAPD